MKFMLAGPDWLDISTVRILFKLNNKDGSTPRKPLHPINPLPANFFRRLRILCGGIVVEDTDFYNRVCNVVHTLLPFERRMNDYAEGFGLSEAYGSYYNDRLKDRGIGFEAGNELPVVRESKCVLFPSCVVCLINPSSYPSDFCKACRLRLRCAINTMTQLPLMSTPPTSGSSLNPR